MHADNKFASIGIEISHKDAEIQQLYFHQFEQLKKVFESTVGDDWNWQLHDYDENGRLISRIYKEKTGVSIFKKEDWPGLISFFKPHIMALDEFWNMVKYSFESLR
jgi:hypothetical protein